ncbi:MAG: hypothetical protein QOE65_1811 [Solirubrobacteraceae bacterium]|nr:hypothetical protein [Solirubrobacteraceae bacterium]
MGWTFVYLMVALKIPIIALLWIVWWAVRATPDVAEAPGDGGVKDRPRPRHPRTPPRRGPRRRDPHGAPLPASPPRVRTTAARARLLEH